MIPKIAHFIWLGSDLPYWAEQNIEQFEIYHPDWDIRVWQSLPDGFPLDLRYIIEHTPWYSSQSDIFSYWLLYEYGGVYMDTDIITLRNFDHLLKRRFFLAPCQPEGHTESHLNCALMGSVPESNAAERIITECLGLSQDNLMRTSYGPVLLTCLFVDIISVDVSVLPSYYFYAIPDRKTAYKFWRATSPERKRILSQFTDEEPYAIHLWGVNGSSQQKVENAVIARS